MLANLSVLQDMREEALSHYEHALEILDSIRTVVYDNDDDDNDDNDNDDNDDTDYGSISKEDKIIKRRLTFTREDDLDAVEERIRSSVGSLRELINSYSSSNGVPCSQDPDAIDAEIEAVLSETNHVNVTLKTTLNGGLSNNIAKEILVEEPTIDEAKIGRCRCIPFLQRRPHR